MNNKPTIILLLIVVFVIQLVGWICLFPALYIQIEFLKIFFFVGLLYLIGKFFIRNKKIDFISICLLAFFLVNSLVAFMCYREFMDSTIQKGALLINRIEEYRTDYRAGNGKYPDKLEEIGSGKELITSIKTPFVYRNNGSYYFLQFDWIDGYVGYYNFYGKECLFTTHSAKKKSGFIEYELRTW